MAPRMAGKTLPVLSAPGWILMSLLKLAHSSQRAAACRRRPQRTTGPLLFESAPTPPSAGFNLAFGDFTLDTAAGAPLIITSTHGATQKGQGAISPSHARVHLHLFFSVFFFFFFFGIKIAEIPEKDPNRLGFITMDLPAYAHSAFQAGKKGALSAVCDVIATTSGDALLLSILRPPLSGKITPESTTVLCRYLFGAPDGLQRALMESHVNKLGTIKGLFLCNHTQTGGVAGLRFALSDAGAEKLSVYGPTGTSEVISSTAGFIPRRFPEVHSEDVSLATPTVFDDGVVRVEVFCLSAPAPVPPLAAPQPHGSHDPGTKMITSLLPCSCPNGHALAPYSTPCDGCWCSSCSCKVQHGTTFFGCRSCDFDLCKTCESTKHHHTSLKTCPSGHILVPYPTPCDDCWCSTCHEKHPAGTFFSGCRACDFDLCQRCFEGSGGCKPGEANQESALGSDKGASDSDDSDSDDSDSDDSDSDDSNGDDSDEGAALIGNVTNLLSSKSRTERRSLSDPSRSKRPSNQHSSEPRKVPKKSRLTDDISSSIPSERVVTEASRLLAELLKDLRESRSMSLSELKDENAQLYSQLIATAEATVGTDSALGTSSVAYSVSFSARMMEVVPPGVGNMFSVLPVQTSFEEKCARNWLACTLPTPLVFHVSSSLSGLVAAPQEVASSHSRHILVATSAQSSESWAKVLPRAAKAWAELHEVAPELYPPPSLSMIQLDRDEDSSRHVVVVSAKGRTSDCLSNRSEKIEVVPDYKDATVSLSICGNNNGATKELSRARTWVQKQAKYAKTRGVQNTDSRDGVDPLPNKSEGYQTEQSNRSAAAALRQRLLTTSTRPPAAPATPSLHLVVLGSGSARPSPRRNCSGILLYATSRRPPDHHSHVVWSMLLDCGEGVLGQIQAHFEGSPDEHTSSDYRFSGRAVKCDDILRELRCVWVSHKHADHHAGLPALLDFVDAIHSSDQDRHLNQQQHNYYFGLARPFVIVAAPEVLAHLAARRRTRPEVLSAHIGASPADANWPQSDAHRLIVESSCVVLAPGGGWAPLLQSFASVPVVHCPGSFGIVLTFQGMPSSTRPFVVVYSGDTRPCPMLVAAGRGCDVLVHEATFDDSRRDDARKKRHSTIGEALKVAKDMGVRGFTVLTHFSQRYPRGCAAAAAAAAATAAAAAATATGAAAEGAEAAYTAAAAPGSEWPAGEADLTSSQVEPRVANQALGPLTIFSHDHLEINDLANVSAGTCQDGNEVGAARALRDSSARLEEYLSTLEPVDQNAESMSKSEGP